MPAKKTVVKSSGPAKLPPLTGVVKPHVAAAAKAPTAVTLPTSNPLSSINDKKNRSRHLRSSKTKKGAKLAGKIAVWARKDLDLLKGVSSTALIPDRKDLRLKGTEANPGNLIKPHMQKAYQGLQSNTLTAHVAGAPAYICRLAEDAAAANRDDYVLYAVDQQTGRTEISVGRLTGKHPGRKKGNLPTMLGDVQQGDHAGHGIPETGVKDPDLVNTLANIVPQDGTANVSHKKVFENQAVAYAENHPTDQIHTIHERFYKGDSLRPLAETHYFVVNGIVATSMTLENP